MRAAKEERVVTIKQDPTSKQKDFGIVGFLKERFATYLVFPRSLREYSGERVIGIKYDVLKSADVAASGDIPRQKPPESKKQKPKPQPKSFSVHVRVTSVAEKEIEVTAWTQAEAKTRALAELKAASDEHTKVAVVSARQLK